MFNYIDAIGAKYPNCNVWAPDNGANYESLVLQSGDPIPSKEQLDADIIAMKRDYMWQRIKAERDSLRNLGVRVNIGNDANGNPVYKFFNSDDTSRIQQLSLVMMGANLPQNLQWKCMDNTYVTMTQTLATTIFQTTAYYDQTNFANAERHRLAMLASEDPLSYDFSTGWLPSYNPLAT